MFRPQALLSFLCIYCASLPSLLAQQKDAPAASKPPITVEGTATPSAAMQTVRLQISASQAYAAGIEVPIKTALIEWDVLSFERKRVTFKETNMVIVLSNLELGCETLQPPATVQLESKAREAFPPARKESDFLVRFRYSMFYEALEPWNDRLGPLVFGKDSKEFQPLGSLPAALHFHYIHYLLNHVSAPKGYYENNPFGGSGNYVFLAAGAKSEQHLDFNESDIIEGPGVTRQTFFRWPGIEHVYTFYGADIPMRPGIVVVTKQDGVPAVDLDVAAEHSVLKSRGTFSMKGHVTLTECPTAVRVYSYKKK